LYLFERREKTWNSKNGGIMEFTIETDYFKLLEDKINDLINRIQEVKAEKDSYLKTINEQKNRIDILTDELTALRESKKQAKERITTIIEKIDKLAV
jgi:chromosome segregation ATPase